MSVRTTDVEFLGGPFDGYRTVVGIEPEQLAWVTTIPVNRNVLLHLTRAKKRGPKQPALSVAVYQLADDSLPHQYCFLGAIPAAETPFRYWQG